jgi:hypothetical protein
MPAFTWVEDNASRSGTIHRLGRRSQNSYKKSWKIFGSTDDVAVHADVNATLWTLYLFWQYPGQPQNQLQAESYTLDYLGDDAWQLTVNYVSRGADDDLKPDPLRRSRSFDTAGGTQHITQTPLWNQFTQSEIGGVITRTPAGDAEKRYPVTGPTAAPVQYGAIGVDGDSVQGVDIVIPAFQWTENYDVPAQYVTANYARVVASLTGCVNNAVFRGFAAGEVLFIGGTGSQDWDQEKGDSPWSLSYRFVASPNADGTTLPKLKVGDIVDIEKKGHEYLWVRYEDSVTDDTLLKKPKHVYVNQVYYTANFAALGIGVT